VVWCGVVWCGVVWCGVLVWWRACLVLSCFVLTYPDESLLWIARQTQIGAKNMTLLIGIALIFIWTIAPNVILLIVTRFNASDDAHIICASVAFIPWSIFGLSLIQ